MAATDILLGRGTITLDGDDVGLCSSLVLRHDVQIAPIATWDANYIGGVAEVARRTRVFVDLTIYELTADNEAKILDLIGDPDSMALVWTGLNKMASDCPSSSRVLTVPAFVPFPADRLSLITDTLDQASIEITGEALRASASTSWYTLT